MSTSRKLPPRLDIEPRTCPVCSVLFEPTNRVNVYCSHACGETYQPVRKLQRYCSTVCRMASPTKRRWKARYYDLNAAELSIERRVEYQSRRGAKVVA